MFKFTFIINTKINFLPETYAIFRFRFLTETATSSGSRFPILKSSVGPSPLPCFVSYTRIMA